VNSAAPIKKDSASPVSKKSIRFPARSFLAFALSPEAPLEEWFQSLDQWTENSPGFFAGRPVVLDLNFLKPARDEVADLVARFGERGIRIYAIEAGGVETLGPDLPPVLRGAKSAVIDEAPADTRKAANANVSAQPERAASSNTLIVDQPIRSGQSVYNPDGDVVVVGSVSSGSEIVAAGSIHVYGTLRGRAFAGATGNDRARIFCRKNEAELVAVDGWYRTADDMEASTRGKPIQVYLDNGVVWIAALN
jgi:septum site-determining protein MinC